MRTQHFILRRLRTVPTTAWRCSLAAFAVAAAIQLNAQPGSLDLTFDPGGGPNGSAYAICVQPDEKIIVAGQFTAFNSATINDIVRLNADGTLDLSFDPGISAGGGTPAIRCIARQPDGKLIIGGVFTFYNGVAHNRIVRLNADGSLDGSFDTGTGASSGVFSIGLQPDGKVIIAGDFQTYDGVSRKGIARLEANGSLDTSFDPGTGTNGSVQCLVLQPDGKMMIGGAFDLYNGLMCDGIVRINSDGSADTTFDPTAGPNNTVRTIALQPDGKVIVGGNFTYYGATPINRIARANADGSLDTSFDPGSGVNLPVNTSMVQPDGRIIIAGHFASYNGTVRNYIARLNTNGSLDTSFDPGTGASASISTLVPQPDGKIMIAGSFTSYNGTARNKVARVLVGDFNSIGSLEIDENGLNLWPNPNNGHLLWLSVPNAPAGALVYVEIYDLSGTRLRARELVTLDGSIRAPMLLGDLCAGMYMLSVHTNDASYTRRITINP